ncbi:hypothetical protein LY41_000546 [Prauserella halophila]|nr:hypothetical protein [Prauserella halophila]
MNGKPAKRRSSLSSSVKRLGRELGVPSWTPELRTAERLAEVVDGMSAEQAERMLGQTVPPLLRALERVREQATDTDAGAAAGRGLSESELTAFLAGLEGDRGPG